MNAGPNRLDLGIFARTFHRDTPAEVAAAVAAAGFGLVQLNLSSFGLPTLPAPADHDRLDASGIRRAFEAHGVRIWGLSASYNTIHPDPAIRRSLLAGYFENIDPGPMHISYGSPSSPPRARSACSSRPTSVGCSSARCKRTASKPWSSPTTRR